MIVTKINAGLGNQFFQYAIGYAAARKLNVDLLLDVSQYLYAPQNAPHPRTYKLNLFNTSHRSFFRLPFDVVIESLAKMGISCNKLRDRYVRRFGGLVYLKEDLDAEAPAISDNSYLHGYWQSERYFGEYAENLKSEFTIGIQLKDDNVKWLNRINNSKKSVSLHYRRGDYHLSDQLNDRYYVNAVNYLADSLKSNDLSLFVFSDQPELAKSRLGKILCGKYRTFIVDGNTEENGHFDLELMKNCRHHIIANSSFSWWSAWLCRYQDKLVIAPELAADRIESTARPCADWVKL